MKWKYYLRSRTIWINFGFLIAALINAYCRAHDIEYEITGYQVMTALAIAGPIANKFIRTKTSLPLTFSRPQSSGPQS